jgi:uncharacterized protein
MKYAPFIYGIVLLWATASCASYERARVQYDAMIGRSDLEGAARLIERKKWYQKSRNQVLYYLELGALARMKGDLRASNEYLNQADILIEDRRASLGSRGLAMVTNPRVMPYQTEYFENIAVHYLKSLNYLQLNDFSAARVEARRANIRLQQLNDAVPDKPLKYRDDVLGHITMALSYEMNGEWNDAFIAYRNAVNLFIDGDRVVPYMGVHIPEQLKCDLIRMGERIGFAGEVQRYTRLLNPRCAPEAGEGGSLVLFWENGKGPIKEENILGFDIFRNSATSEVRFVNQRQGLEYAFGPQAYNEYNGFAGVNAIRLALPAFQPRPYPLRTARIQYPGGTKSLELIEDLNQVAQQSLRDRFGRELANALLRLAAKEAMEASLRSIQTKKRSSSSPEPEPEPEPTEEKKDAQARAGDRAGDRARTPPEASKEREAEKPAPQEDEYSNTAGLILGSAMGIVNVLTERADTRSWQSLPAEIHYQRIPLRRGQNEIKVTFSNQYNQRTEEATILVEGRGGMVVRNLITPEARAILPITN